MLCMHVCLFLFVCLRTRSCVFILANDCVSVLCMCISVRVYKSLGFLFLSVCACTCVL